MSVVRLHCRHAASGMDLYLEFMSLEVAMSQLKRLQTELGCTGVAGEPAHSPERSTREHAASTAIRQRLDRIESCLVQLLQEVQRVSDLHLALDTRLEQLLQEQAEAQRPPTPAEAPRSAPPSVAPGQAASGPTAPMPPRWEAILTYLHHHPGPQRPVDVGRELGMQKGVRDVMRRMKECGLLQGQAGSYELATPERERESRRASQDTAC